MQILQQHLENLSSPTEINHGAFDGLVVNLLLVCQSGRSHQGALVSSKHALATGSFPLLFQRLFFREQIEGKCALYRGKGGCESVDAKL